MEKRFFNGFTIIMQNIHIYSLGGYVEKQKSIYKSDFIDTSKT